MPGIEVIFSFVLVGALMAGLMVLLGKDKRNVNGCCTGSGESLEKCAKEQPHE